MSQAELEDGEMKGNPLACIHAEATTATFLLISYTHNASRDIKNRKRRDSRGSEGIYAKITKQF